MPWFAIIGLACFTLGGLGIYAIVVGGWSDR